MNIKKIIRKDDTDLSLERVNYRGATASVNDPTSILNTSLVLLTNFLEKAVFSFLSEWIYNFIKKSLVI